MPDRIGLGVPTGYDFELPRRRHALARPFVPAHSVTLDFGCGNGANTVLFAPDVAQIVGVDVVAGHLETATAQARERALANVHYVRYDGRRLPFADHTFDHAVSFEVLEHTEDDGQALEEVRRVLRPGAAFTLSVPNKWYLMETHGFDLRPQWIPWNRVPLLSWLPTGLHERYAQARIYTRRRITDLLESHGFRVIDHRYLMPPFDRVAGRRAKAALSTTFDRIGGSPLQVVGVAHFIAAARTD